MGARDVAYIGWKVYGEPLHVKFLGSHLMCRKPFCALATMKPLCPVVRSSMWLISPCGVSRIVTTRLSPGFISRVAALGVNEASVKLSGPAGPVGTPLR